MRERGGGGCPAQGRTQGRGAGPRRSQDVETRMGLGRGGSSGAVGAGAVPGHPQVLAGHLVLVRQPQNRQVCEAAPSVRFEEAKHELAWRRKDELRPCTTTSLQETCTARPHHATPQVGPRASAPGAHSAS